MSFRAGIAWTQGWPFLALSLLAGPILQRASVVEWGVTVAGIAAFALLALALQRASGAATLLLGAASIVLGVAFAPSNPGASACFILAACAIAGTRIGNRARALLASYVLGVAAYASFVGLSPSFWIPTILGAGTAGAATLAFVELQEIAERERTARDNADRAAREGERERISRDLHDILGHTLSVVALKCELASHLLRTDRERAESEISDVARVARETLSELRLAIAGFRAANAAEEVRRACGLLETAGIRAKAEIGSIDLTAEQQAAVALAVREAVTNVLRHATKARECTMRLTQSDGNCSFEIRDDGQGGLAAEGFGLSGMRERMQALGGEVYVDHLRGTYVRILIPTAMQS